MKQLFIHKNFKPPTLGTFAQTGVELHRIALNMDQVEAHDLPPNPAKLSDSRAAGYVNQFGAQSWELDALDPRVLSELIETTVHQYIDVDLWSESVAREDSIRAELALAHKSLLQRGI